MRRLTGVFAKANLNETDVCELKRNALAYKYGDSVYALKNNFNFITATKSILSTRIPDKDFTEMFNLLQFLAFNTTPQQNQRALVSNKLCIVLKLY